MSGGTRDANRSTAEAMSTKPSKLRWASAGGVNSSADAVGRPGEKSTKREESAALRCPFANTSVRSGTPVERSAYTSTWRTADCASDGVSRSPSAVRPATRRAGSRRSSELRAPASERRASSCGSRSVVVGSRTCTSGTVAALLDS